MEAILTWVSKFAVGRLWWTIIPTFATGWLIQRYGTVKLAGLQFFPSRSKLERLRPLSEQLRSAENVYSIHVTGRKLWLHNEPGTGKIRKVILPDPRSASFKDYSRSVGESPEMTRMVCRATRMAKNAGKEVRWYPEVVHCSINIADPETVNGWVHVELTPPYTTGNLRPSFTMYRRVESYERTILDFWSMFQSMWKDSKEPSWTFVKHQLNDDTKSPTAS